MSDALPEGWCIAPLDVLGEWGSGGTPSRARTAFFVSGTIPWLKIGDLNDGVVRESEERITQEAVDQSSARLVPKGTLLVAMYGSIGKLGIAGIECATNQAIAFCRHPIVDVKYLFLLLRSKRDVLLALGKGGAQANISQTVLKGFKVPVAPVVEQRRIVSRVEPMLKLVQRAKDHLDRAALLMRRFRQAVLAAACSGRLTEEWRERRGARSGTPSRLEELARRRRELWERRASARGGRRQKCPDPLRAVAPDSVEIPEEWRWVSVSSLALLDVGFAFKSDGFRDTGIRLLRGENIEPGALRWTDEKCWPCDDVKQHSHLLVESGEIILGMDRPLVSAGLKIARAKEEDLPALLVQRVMRFKMVDPADTDYLHLCLSERRFIGFLAHDGTTGSDLPHITGTGVAEFAVPLPPSDEQAEVVRRVAALFACATAIERRVGRAVSRAGRLTQAVLSKAFAGELVPTEAELARVEGRNFETAEELLGRVRNGQAGVRPASRRRAARRERRTRA